MKKHKIALSALALVVSLPVFAVAQTAPPAPQLFNLQPIDLTEVNRATCEVLRFMEGGFGALLATVAGIGAVVAAAFGMYRTMISMIVVALGCTLARSLLNLWFFVPDCTGITVPDNIFNAAACKLIRFMEGSFGALLLTLSGLVTVISAAVGAYRAGFAMMATGAGAVILRSFTGLFFDMNKCDRTRGMVSLREFYGLGSTAGPAQPDQLEELALELKKP